MILSGASGSPGQNREVLQRRMEKYSKRTNGGNKAVVSGRAESAANVPPTVRTGREALCVAVELSQTLSHGRNP